MAFQVPLGIHGRHTARTSRGDRLTVHMVLHIARGEDTRHTGHRPPMGDQISPLVHLQLAGEQLGIGKISYVLVKYPGDQQAVITFIRTIDDRIAAVGEKATEALTKQTILDHEIYLGNEVMFKVHRGILQMPTSIFPSLDQSHYIFYYPVGWKNKALIYDGYTPKTIFEHLIYGLSRIVLHLAFIVALAGIAVTFYLLKNSEETTLNLTP